MNEYEQKELDRIKARLCRLEQQRAELQEEICRLNTRLGHLYDSVAGDSEIHCEHLLRLARSLVYYLENVP